MKKSINERLAELNIKIPDGNSPAANYVSYKIIGSMVYISGQTCRQNGKVAHAGKIGSDLSIEDGIEAARICGLNIISQLSQACAGDLERVKNTVKLTVFINSTEDFYQQATVANGVSDLMVAVFGDKGRHTRSSISAYSIPSNSAVEVDAIFEIE